MSKRPVLWWVRRDMRLDDNPGLAAMAASGRPVIPVFVLDPETEAIGAAALWRMGLGIQAYGDTLHQIGSRLVLRRGPALEVLLALIAETGAEAVHWGRLYDPTSRARDTAIKAHLRTQGIEAYSHPGHLLWEPWEVETAQGGFFRVYSPFWRAASRRGAPTPAPRVAALLAPEVWPRSENLQDWAMGARMQRGAAIVMPHLAVGETAAALRLSAFLDTASGGYRAARDFPAQPATSRLSENLTLGEIGPRAVWHAAQRRVEAGEGDEHFLKELTWREFAWHLLYHTPHLETDNWRDGWNSFAWRGDSPDAEAWRRGMTGVPFVDAGMREMYVTGTMHNRTRMIVASYLTKHLMTHWKVGLQWFSDCLVDWDPAANAMGWQWVAGSGPDAAPYFRIFNPVGQADKFDPDSAYVRRFVAELSRAPGSEARAYFDAVPRAWGLDAAAPYPRPSISLADGRARALAAYSARADGAANAVGA